MSGDITFTDNKAPITIRNESSIRRPTVIGKLIEIIATNSATADDLRREPADIEVKIKLNDLKRSKRYLKDYRGESLLVDDSIKELNRNIMNGGRKLKRQMKDFYTDSLCKYSIEIDPFDLNKLRENSDNIVEDVAHATMVFVKNSSDLQDGYFEEDIVFGVNLIVGYSIVECIVMENPHDHD
ncbi:hypothetical protein U0O11_12840 [Cobetia sp. D5]|uniref:hypothetical protein n=1 Tax=Cobetia sp. D5 TaxID=3105867 RepID=UPI002D784591|nr:hypothetical protein [Cobetia sp. D5]